MLIRPPVVRDLRRDLWTKMTAKPGEAPIKDPRTMSIPRTGGNDPRLAALKELGELRAAGVLNDEEFAREKARILG